MDVLADDRLEGTVELRHELLQVLAAVRHGLGDARQVLQDDTRIEGWGRTFAGHGGAPSERVGMGRIQDEGNRSHGGARNMNGTKAAPGRTDPLPTAWCVLQWKESSRLLREYTVGPSRPSGPEPMAGATVVRHFRPEYIAQDENGWPRYETGVEVLERAEAFAEALNERGATRERALRQLETGR